MWHLTEAEESIRAVRFLLEKTRRTSRISCIFWSTQRKNWMSRTELLPKSLVNACETYPRNLPFTRLIHSSVSTLLLNFKTKSCVRPASRK